MSRLGPVWGIRLLSSLAALVVVLAALSLIPVEAEGVPAGADGADGAALVVANRGGTVLGELPLDNTREFRVTFIHSSERHPWVNVFLVAGVEMVLKEIRVPSTGPGVPSVVEPGWHVTIVDGWIVYSGVDRPYEELVFLLSDISPHIVEAGGVSYDLVSLFGDGTLVRLRVAAQ
ncbi:MAG: DUF1850 domain-containing protein [Firmicutes bacterium]|jgi:hypothetical protein|nr:DUF1850 domain-containing protein [Bacillota bacterium]